MSPAIHDSPEVMVDTRSDFRSGETETGRKKMTRNSPTRLTRHSTYRHGHASSGIVACARSEQAHGMLMRTYPAITHAYSSLRTSNVRSVRYNDEQRKRVELK